MFQVFHISTAAIWRQCDLDDAVDWNDATHDNTVLTVATEHILHHNGAEPASKAA